VEYGILGYLLARAVGTGSACRWSLILLLGGAVGACDEIRQSMVPGRNPSWTDWGADLLGNGMGAAVFAALDLKRVHPRHPASEGEGRK